MGANAINRGSVQRQIAFADRLAARLGLLFGGVILLLRLDPSHAPCLPLLSAALINESTVSREWRAGC